MATPSFHDRSDVDDWVLLHAAQRGDRQAFGALLEHHWPGIEKLCRLMLCDSTDAEHVMREAVLTAWRERGLAPASSSVRMWLYRIAVRVCLEALGCVR
jgi:RNA polymerase sigma-70 factor, ECF subfamily